MMICALCRYESSDSMTVDCPPSVLAPGASQEVSIIFSPCEARSYREEIPFKVNGLYTMKVVVMGEGSNLKLELGNAAHRNLNLGAVSCGGQTSKTVQVRPLIAAAQHARLLTEVRSACLPAPCWGSISLALPLAESAERHNSAPCVCHSWSKQEVLREVDCHCGADCCVLCQVLLSC